MAKEHSPEYTAWQQAVAAQKQAEKQYKKDVSSAKSSLNAAQSQYNARVRSAQNAIDNAHKTWQKPLQILEELKLYNDRVESNQHRISFDGKDIQIEINAGGTIYTTTSTKGGKGVSLGGAALGAAVAGPLGAVIGGSKNTVETTSHVHDNRTLYLTIRSTTNAFTVKLNPEKESEARAFADAVYTTNRSYPKHYAQLQQDLQALNNNLVNEQNDHEAVDLAQQNYNDVVANTTAVDAAKRETERCLNLVPAQELEQAKKDKQRMIIISIAIAVAVVVILVVLYLIGSHANTTAMLDYANAWGNSNFKTLIQ